MCGAVTGTMAMLALAFAYLAGRYGNDGWVDPKMQFNNYTAVTIVVTLVLASMAAGWGVTASRLNNRRHGATGFGLALVFDLAALNLLWSIGQGFAFGAKDSDYGTVVYTMVIASGLAIAIGAASCVAGLALSFGGHANSNTRYQALAASVGQHFAGIAWLIPFMAIYLKK
jgi:heme/copper-type cytochrome/quinol oxidase subunit 3